MAPALVPLVRPSQSFADVKPVPYEVTGEQFTASAGKKLVAAPTGFRSLFSSEPTWRRDRVEIAAFFCRCHCGAAPCRGQGAAGRPPRVFD